jgi:hypothetical protein
MVAAQSSTGSKSRHFNAFEFLWRKPKPVSAPILGAKLSQTSKSALPCYLLSGNCQYQMEPPSLDARTTDTSLGAGLKDRPRMRNEGEA